MDENRKKHIENALHLLLKPTTLELIDESHHHVGHVGAQTGLSHVALIIESPLFKNTSMLQRHRLIYDALGDLMQTDIHALRIISAQPPTKKESHDE